MKKLVSMMLTLSLVFGTTLTAGATQTITFDVSGNASVTTEAPLAPEKSYLALGSDLTQNQLATVLGLMGINPAELGNYNVVYVTNADEHKYLDQYIAPSVIGTRSLSSVLVKPMEKGHGVVVTTKNINYCTTNMYRNALITAGVEDADIMVVGPSQISGTAGLIGALKAYEQMSGETVSEKALDTALNELVATGELSTSVGDNSEAEELISYIKAQIAANDLDTPEQIEAVIRKGMKDKNIELSEEEIKKTVDLMMKIKAMGIDFNVLASQAEDIYAKYKTQIDNGTFNIDDVDIKDLGIGKMISNAVGNFVSNVGSSIKSFFSGLFKKKK